MKKNFSWAALAGPACWRRPRRARLDVWDQATEDDNAVGTDNGITHGTEQTHDLGANAGSPDQDWYTLDSAGRSSYEVVVDGTTGDMNLSGSDVQRLSSSGSAVLQDSCAARRLQPRAALGQRHLDRRDELHPHPGRLVRHHLQRERPVPHPHVREHLRHPALQQHGRADHRAERRQHGAVLLRRGVPLLQQRRNVPGHAVEQLRGARAAACSTPPLSASPRVRAARSSSPTTAGTAAWPARRSLSSPRRASRSIPRSSPGYSRNGSGHLGGREGSPGSPRVSGRPPGNPGMGPKGRSC